MSELNNMSGPTFDAWLQEQSGLAGVSDDELLADAVSKVMREEDPTAKAQSLIDVANMCMAMADKNLGCQVPVATCLTLTRH